MEFINLKNFKNEKTYYIILYIYIFINIINFYSKYIYI